MNLLDLDYYIDVKDKVITIEYTHLEYSLVQILKNSIDNKNIRKTSLYSVFQHFIHFFKGGYVFKIYHHTEGHDFEILTYNEEFDIKLSDVVRVFKDTEEFPTNTFFKIVSGNMWYPYFDKSVDYYEPTLIGFFSDYGYSFDVGNQNIDDSFLENKIIDKKFTYLNRIPKVQRAYLFNRIWNENRNILDNSYWSWNSVGSKDYAFYNDSHPIKSIEGIGTTTLDDESTNFFGKELIRNSFCSIIMESEIGDTSLFLTEKIIKPILFCQPFLVLGSYKYYEMLQELGFKTFSDFWDESFESVMVGDNHTGLFKKCDRFYEQIDYINTMSNDKLVDIHKKMIPILVHNRNLLIDIFNKKFGKHTHLVDMDNTSVFLHRKDKQDRLTKHRI